MVGAGIDEAVQGASGGSVPDPSTLVAMLAILLALAVLGLWAWNRRLRRRLRDAKHQLQSQATRHGQVAEQFAPFLASWPWDPKQFRFIGSPIDGIQFTDQGVVFVEVKTGNGRLTASQQQVKDHVEAGRVTWREVRIG